MSYRGFDFETFMRLRQVEAGLRREAMPMKTDADLGHGWKFKQVIQEEDEDGPAQVLFEVYTPADGSAGFLWMQRDDAGDFFVAAVDARHGWGAFLYEKAMQFATEHGRYLESDTVVSEDARGVWRKYHERPDMERAPRNTAIEGGGRDERKEPALDYKYRFKPREAPQMTPRSGGLRWGRAGAGMLFICEEDNTLFLALRSPSVKEPYYWGIPGGNLDGNESALQGAKREVQEELGTLPSHRVVTQVQYNKPDFTYTTFICAVDAATKKRWQPRLNWENTEADWFPRDALPSPLHFGAAYALQHLPQEPQEQQEEQEEQGAKPRKADVALSHPEQYDDLPGYGDNLSQPVMEIRDTFEGEDRFEDLDGTLPLGRPSTTAPGLSSDPVEDEPGSYEGQEMGGYQQREAAQVKQMQRYVVKYSGGRVDGLVDVIWSDAPPETGPMYFIECGSALSADIFDDSDNLITRYERGPRRPGTTENSGTPWTAVRVPLPEQGQEREAEGNGGTPLSQQVSEPVGDTPVSAMPGASEAPMDVVGRRAFVFEAADASLVERLVKRWPHLEEGIRALAQEDPTGNLRWLDWDVKQLRNGAQVEAVAQVQRDFFANRDLGEPTQYATLQEAQAALQSALEAIEWADSDFLRVREVTRDVAEEDAATYSMRWKDPDLHEVRCLSEVPEKRYELQYNEYVDEWRAVDEDGDVLETAPDVGRLMSRLYYREGYLSDVPPAPEEVTAPEEAEPESQPESRVAVLRAGRRAQVFGRLGFSDPSPAHSTARERN